MKSGLDVINEYVDRLINQSLSYVSSVVIGDNSSGKSLFLRKFIEKASLEGNVYFIDAVNRFFDVKKVSKTEKKPEYRKSIMETRLKVEYFNLVDSFNYYGTSTERIERIYTLYEREVQDLFEELTGERFSLREGDIFGYVDFKKMQGLLSSGYQAIIRILLEMLYYSEMVIAKSNVNTAWVVIDEVDEFLSPKYSSKLIEFLKEKFPWASWLVTTHSCDLVAETRDMNLIVLKNGEFEVVDINDYSSISEVQIIFKRVFGNQLNQESVIDNDLRRLLNNKISNAWGEEEEDLLCRLKKEKLSASQQLIVKQIQEW